MSPRCFGGYRRPLAGLAIVISALLASCGGDRGAPASYLVVPDQVRISGAFLLNGGAYPGSHWARAADLQTYFASWAGPRSFGQLTTGAFPAPAELTLLLAGSPSAEGNSLYLLENGGTDRLQLKTVADPGLEWTRCTWNLPYRWRGKTVRLVAEDRSPAGWFGLTLPAAAAPPSASVMLGRVFTLVVSVVMGGALFLLPGTALATLLHFRRSLDPIGFACVALVASAGTGYAAFWAYWLNPHLGKAFSAVAMVFAVISIGGALWKRRLRRSVLRPLMIAAALAALVATFYSGLTWMYRYSDSPSLQAAHRYRDLPMDNLLPYLFADRVFHAQPIKPYLVYGWKSSDRPPLQTGIVLLQFPLWQASARDWYYQGLATFLQASWIAAIWIFMAAAGFPRRIVGAVLGFCVLSPFFLQHTIFVWPKLLSAALFLVGLAVLRFAGGEGITRAFDAGLAAAAIALAFLSHSGIAFTLIALAAYLLARRNVPPPKAVACGLLVASVFVAPWMLYQKLYDPPGDRLLKWHLAGVVDLDSSSLHEALLEAYRKPKFSEILHNKIANLAALVGDEPMRFARALAGRAPLDDKALVRDYVEGAFFHLAQTLGLLDLGLFAFVYARLFRRRRTDAVLAAAQRLLLLAGASIIVWCLLIYLPGGALVHAGSFGDVLLLFIASAASLACLAPRLAGILLAAQALLLFPLFVLATPLLHSAPDTVWAGSFDAGMALLSLLSGALLCALAVAVVGVPASRSRTQVAAAADTA